MKPPDRHSTAVIQAEIGILSHASVEQIREVLIRGRRTVPEIQQIRELLARRMPRADRRILYALTRHLFEDEVASFLLSEILHHKQRLEGKLERAVSIKVAALDYFEVVEEISDGLELIHEDQLRQLVEFAIYDELTGALAQNSFEPWLAQEFERSRRYGQPLTLLCIDIDHFKRYNDDFGHLAGDNVLSEIGAIHRDLKRDTDLFFRPGGEEFALLLPETNAVDAARLAERLLEEIPRRTGAAAGIQRPVTVSIGLAELGPVDVDPRDLYERADHALYQAKHAGRDQLSIACGAAVE